MPDVGDDSCTDVVAQRRHCAQRRAVADQIQPKVPTQYSGS
jgi:hypothetical protein